MTSSEIRHSLSGPPELWEMKRAFQMKLMRDVGLLPEHRFLDIGCGTLRGGLPVVRYLKRAHYYGIDIRRTVLSEARHEIEEADLHFQLPRLMTVARFDELCSDLTFDFILAFSVLIHMEDGSLDECLERVFRHLKPNGTFFANVNIGRRGNSSWSGFPVIWRTLAFYTAVTHNNHLYICDSAKLRDLGHVSGNDVADDQLMLAIRKNIDDVGSKILPQS